MPKATICPHQMGKKHPPKRGENGFLFPIGKQLSNKPSIDHLHPFSRVKGYTCLVWSSAPDLWSHGDSHCICQDVHSLQHVASGLLPELQVVGGIEPSLGHSSGRGTGKQLARRAIQGRCSKHCVSGVLGGREVDIFTARAFLRHHYSIVIPVQRSCLEASS